MFLVKIFWVALLFMVIASFVFLGFSGIPMLQVPVSKVKMV